MIDGENKIIVRKFNVNDSNDVAEIKTDAFGSKAGKLYQTKKEKLGQMFLRTLNKNTENGLLVAEENGKVLGYMKLKSRELEYKKEKINWFSFIKEFGLKDSLLFIVVRIFIESSIVAKDECYICQIAVSKSGRGKGIGTALMKAGEEFCAGNPNIKRYTLYVMTENEGAHKLYKRLGFKDKRIEKIPLLKHITGYKAAYFMEKNV